MATAPLLWREAPWGDFDSVEASAAIQLRPRQAGNLRGLAATCINRGDQGPRIVGPGVPRGLPLPRHLHDGCDGRLWRLWIEGSWVEAVGLGVLGGATRTYVTPA